MADSVMDGGTGEGTRERIVAAASRLLEQGGRSAVSTRAVSAAAGVQAPTIYRLFGDKQGLLQAVAADGLARYLADKRARTPSDDPVADLRAGWDAHVGLGLAQPALYALLYEDQSPSVPSPAAAAADEVLAGLIGRIAEAGRLRVPQRRASQLLQAAGRGTTLLLLSLPEDARDPELSATAREAVVAAITTDADAVPAPAADIVTAAVTLSALLPRTEVLSDPERSLLQEWLGRLAASGG